MFPSVMSGRVVLASALTFCLTGPALGDDAVLLKARFSAGRTHYIETQTETVQTMPGPAGKMKVTLRQTSGRVEKVESASSKGAKIVVTLDRFAVDSSNPMMGKMSYDSDMPDSDASPRLKELFAPMIGTSTTAELDGDNQITSYTGMEAVLKKVAASAANNPFLPGIKRSLTDERAKQSWHDLHLALLPNKKVKPGESWKQPVENRSSQMGTVVYDCNFKLDRMTEAKGQPVAVITYTGKAKKDQTLKPPGMPPGMALVLETGEISGTFSFDPAAGELVRKEQTVRIKVAMKAEGNAAMAMPGGAIEVQNTEVSRVISVAEREKEKLAHRKEAEIKKKAEAAKKPENKAGK
ncbi:MAG: DUF6263 family protein [Phycisphaerae bacterium]